MKNGIQSFSLDLYVTLDAVKYEVIQLSMMFRTCTVQNLSLSAKHLRRARTPYIQTKVANDICVIDEREREIDLPSIIDYGNGIPLHRAHVCIDRWQCYVEIQLKIE